MLILHCKGRGGGDLQGEGEGRGGLLALHTACTHDLGRSSGSGDRSSGCA